MFQVILQHAKTISPPAGVEADDLAKLMESLSA